MAQSYGAANGQAQRQTRSARDEEDTPLLDNANGPARPWTGRLRDHMTQDVVRHRTDLLLLCLYAITGLLDSSSILVWGSFVSMQTGNSIYLGLGLADPRAGTRWLKAVVSIACFCAGSFAFARWHRGLGERRRWVMAASHAAQAGCVAAAAAIVALDGAAGDGGKGEGEMEVRWQVAVPIALVAFQAGGQAVTSRALEFNALTSVVLTSIYCDLVSDARLFVAPAENPDRNRRIAAPLLLLLGAVAGGHLGKTSEGIVMALWVAVVMKLLVVVAWLVWKPEKAEDS